MSPSHGVRRRSREMALQVLFQTEFLNSGSDKDRTDDGVRAASEVLRRFNEDFAIEKEVSDYGNELFLGVIAKLQAVDGLIQSHSAHWKISRMGLVDLLVMRIAVYEMMFAQTRITPNIAIDEAVEMAKLFGSTESGAFVNGILDQVAREATGAKQGGGK